MTLRTPPPSRSEGYYVSPGASRQGRTTFIELLLCLWLSAGLRGYRGDGAQGGETEGKPETAFVVVSSHQLAAKLGHLAPSLGVRNKEKVREGFLEKMTPTWTPAG